MNFLLFIGIFQIFQDGGIKKTYFAQQYECIFLICSLGVGYLSFTIEIIFVAISSDSSTISTVLNLTSDFSNKKA